MDLDIIQSTKEGEITQFLCDVRDYFRASLATSEYENTSNMFFMTESDVTEQLLQRCEQLLTRLGNNKCRQDSNQQNLITYTIPKPIVTPVTNGLPHQQQWQITSKDNIKTTAAPKHHQQQQPNHHPHQSHVTSKTINGCSTTTQPDRQQSASRIHHQQQHDDVSYLDMSAAHNNNKKKSSTSLRESNVMNSSVDSDKTFRCSTMIVKQNKSFLHRLHDTMTTTTDEEAETDSLDGQLDDEFEDDPQIYDICQVTTQGSDGEEDHLGQEETHKAITPDAHFALPHMECPYMDLPAGHMAIHKSAKYGQLQRIEKRLFFDQSKKCYCGILNDWLLCYADGPTSNKPTISLYLKMPGIEIEHFGEGKRRDVCFQVSTPDPSKRFVFQAVNEIDAKEWIHAIEAAIRSDIGSGAAGVGGVSITNTRNSSTARKLPTPPVMKKMTFLSTFQKAYDMKHNANANSTNNANAMTSSATASDCIYEEPSPVYNVTNVAGLQPPELPQKQSSPSAMAQRFEYDVPKCPPLPLANGENEDIQLINPYDNDHQQEGNSMQSTPPKNHSTSSLTSSPPVVNLNFTTPPKINLKMEEKLNFQAKVKDVHSKLSSQLSNGPTLKLKPLKKSYSSSGSSLQQGDGESLIMSSSPSSPSSLSSAELKKQKKSPTPQNSPQKSTDKTTATKNWFLNRLNKTTSSTRSNGSSSSAQSSTSNSNVSAKCKQSEKENLLNSSADNAEGYDHHESHLSSNPASPILKSSSTSCSSAASTPIASTNGKGKVNMLINQLEASGHLASIFTADAVASFSSFCGDNDCNNYEPIMTVSSPPNSFLKKV
uniref:PH domain-containing protein n=1 Tax=Stomoxys calcitrans TaxID=35570 RepID=A0A1I8Q2A0_STOCA